MSQLNLLFFFFFFPLFALLFSLNFVRYFGIACLDVFFKSLWIKWSDDVGDDCTSALAARCVAQPRELQRFFSLRPGGGTSPWRRCPYMETQRNLWPLRLDVTMEAPRSGTFWAPGLRPKPRRRTARSTARSGGHLHWPTALFRAHCAVWDGAWKKWKEWYGGRLEQVSFIFWGFF